MIPYQNIEIYASVVFLIFTKFLSYIVDCQRLSMYKDRRTTLTSIPESNEIEDVKKWVPKKKHEVLKAKYKCLKKLFQIYDASVIGILPEPCSEEYEETKESKRKRRSHRTKTDACAGTTEVSSGDVSLNSESDRCQSIPTAVIRDLKINSSIQFDTKSITSKIDKYAATQSSKEDLSIHECECTQTCETHHHPIPYLMLNEKRKLTRFQIFIQRIFGIRPERRYKSQTSGHIYAASDNNISHHFEKRRRRGLRFRRLKRPKKIQSEIALRDVRSPVILTYVQSVQRSCLMDTTPRQCPIMGCRMMFYGIINYNDHLNLCHFTDRKYICHYCHEGFEREYDKYVHENEHIGITKLSMNTNLLSASSERPSVKKASDTQTDPELTSNLPEDKLKKIVSFFDKIPDTDRILSEMNKNRYSESNFQRSKTDTTNSMSDSDKRTVSCVNLQKGEKKCSSSADSGVTSKYSCDSPVTCHFCGENFDFRRQLSLHVDLEHRVHDKFSKFHSCAGICNPRHHLDMTSEDGHINVQSTARSCSGIQQITSSTITNETYSVSRRKSDETLSCDPSTNIIYYTSTESVKKPSLVDSLVKRVKSGITYKWEPGTKIIRV